MKLIVELNYPDGFVRSQESAIAHLATVPGIDARIVKPSDWPALRDALDAAPKAVPGEGEP